MCVCVCVCVCVCITEAGWVSGAGIGGFEEEKKFLLIPAGIRTLDHPARILLTIQTELQSDIQ